jgi:DNA-binding CsgD family transcriptional regulator
MPNADYYRAKIAYSRMMLHPRQTAEQIAEHRQLEQEFERQCYGAIFPPKVHQVESVETLADWIEAKLHGLSLLKRLAKISDELWFNEPHDGSRKTIADAYGLARKCGIKADAPPSKEISRADEFTRLYRLQETVLATMEGTATADESGKPKRKRRRSAAPLTDRQNDFYKCWAENGENIEAVAEKMKCSRANVHGHLLAVSRKTGVKILNKPRPKRQPIPTDHRGQAAIADKRVKPLLTDSRPTHSQT